MQRRHTASISSHWICAVFAKSSCDVRVGIEHSGVERGAQVTRSGNNAGKAIRGAIQYEKNGIEGTSTHFAYLQPACSSNMTHGKLPCLQEELGWGGAIAA